MLEPELVLNAYRRGIFPMAVDHRGRIGWFSPDPRAVIPLDERFHISHGLRRVWLQKKFTITFNADFASVIHECAQRKEGTWISPGINKCYSQLHRLGYAHSVETRLQGKLVGGLYGVALGGAFFGESMFHRTTDASKIALVVLVERLRSSGYVLLDTQWTTPHLQQFGTFEIPRAEYLWRLEHALKLACQF
jgi:leucyl/phenylalanyl-tRNA--protein transferase